MRKRNFNQRVAELKAMTPDELITAATNHLAASNEIERALSPGKFAALDFVALVLDRAAAEAAQEPTKRNKRSKQEAAPVDDAPAQHTGEIPFGEWEDQPAVGEPPADS